MRRGRGTAARVARISAWTLAALVALVLVVAVGVPLVVRGPVLAGVVARASKNLCGSIKVSGGHVSAGVALALLRQRPFEVALDGVVIKTPEGEEMFRARTIRANMNVLRRPWRLEIDGALLANSTWKLADEGFGEPLMTALDRVPRGGRSQCGAPKPEQPPKAPTQGDIVIIRNLALRDVSVVLSFSVWAVSLDSTDAEVGITMTGKGMETETLFDVHNIDAKRGGYLRVGGVSHRLTPQIPFDRVKIARVAVLDSAPQNLLLEVEEGRTAEAVLSGKAVFTDILGPSPHASPPGMKLDARYTAVGQAVQRSPNWAEVGKRLADLNAGLEVHLHGPFDELNGSAAVTGDGVSLNARALPRRRFEADVGFDKLETGPLIPPAQRDQLSGRLDGHIAVSAKLGPRSIDTTVSVDRLELDLLRHGKVTGPRRLVINHGPGASSSDDVRIGLGVIALEREVLRVASLRVRGPGWRLDTSLRAERQPASGAFLFQATTEPASHVTVGGETFVLPPLVDVRFQPRRSVTVQPFSIVREGGGTIDVGGSLQLDGSTDLRAAVHGYPLAHIPGLADVQAPGQAAPLARVLRGQMDASLRLHGPIAQPRLSGELATTNVRWAGRRLGDGRIVFDGVAGGTRFEGALIDGVDVSGQLHARARRDDFVGVSLRDLRLGSWLPQPAAALGLRASGNVVVTAPARSPRTTATGDVSISGTGVALNLLARLRPERGTASVHGRVDLGRVDVGLLSAKFPSLRLRSVAGVITADVNWQGAADVNGGGLWPYARYPEALAGVAGALVVEEPVSLASARLPDPVTVAPTRIELGGNEVRVPGVEVHFGGDVRATVAGRVHDIDWSQPDGATVEAKLTATADGRELGRWLGDGATSGGMARFAGQLSGAVRAPRIVGQASFDDLIVSWPRSPVGAVHVNGPLAFDGREIAVGPLMVRTENGGWLKIAGSQGAAGQLTLAPGGALLPAHGVDLIVQGGGLGTIRPVAGLSVKDLALGLRLAENGDNRLRVTGEVRLGHNVFDVAELRKGAAADGAKKPAPAKSPAKRQSALDRILVDVRVTGPDDAVTVRVPYAPQVTVGLNCHVHGVLTTPRISGEVRGSGAYSRAALATADRFTERDLRGCDLGPR